MAIFNSYVKLPEDISKTKLVSAAMCAHASGPGLSMSVKKRCPSHLENLEAPSRG
jgi:hypothetical protein